MQVALNRRSQLPVGHFGVMGDIKCALRPWGFRGERGDGL